VTAKPREKRKNGRPAGRNFVAIAAYLTSDMLEEIEMRSKFKGVTRTGMIRMLLAKALKPGN
jgi:hypothetical protein